MSSTVEVLDTVKTSTIVVEDTSDASRLASSLGITETMISQSVVENPDMKAGLHGGGHAEVENESNITV